MATEKEFFIALQAVKETGTQATVGTFTFSVENRGRLRVRQVIWRVDTLLSTRPVYETLSDGVRPWPRIPSGLKNLARACARDNAAEMKSRASFSDNPKN